MKKFLLLLLIAVLTLSLCACNEGGKEDPSGAPASKAELTDNEARYYDDYICAAENRSSYLSAVFKRNSTENGETISVVYTHYTPYGLGAFYFDKVGTKRGEVVFTERFGGSLYTYNYGGETISIGSAAYTSTILPRASKDSVTHTRVPLSKDFDYRLFIPDKVEYSEKDGLYNYKITFDTITSGALLLEYGEEGEYVAENVSIEATTDDDEVLVYEKITAEIVKIADGSRATLVLETTTESVNAVEALPAENS